MKKAEPISLRQKYAAASIPQQSTQSAPRPTVAAGQSKVPPGVFLVRCPARLPESCRITCPSQAVYGKTPFLCLSRVRGARGLSAASFAALLSSPPSCRITCARQAVCGKTPLSILVAGAGVVVCVCACVCVWGGRGVFGVHKIKFTVAELCGLAWQTEARNTALDSNVLLKEYHAEIAKGNDDDFFDGIDPADMQDPRQKMGVSSDIIQQFSNRAGTKSAQQTKIELDHSDISQILTLCGPRP